MRNKWESKRDIQRLASLPVLLLSSLKVGTAPRSSQSTGSCLAADHSILVLTGADDSETEILHSCRNRCGIGYAKIR